MTSPTPQPDLEPIHPQLRQQCALTPVVPDPAKTGPVDHETLIITQKILVVGNMSGPGGRGIPATEGKNDMKFGLLFLPLTTILRAKYPRITSHFKGRCRRELGLGGVHDGAPSPTTHNYTSLLIVEGLARGFI